MSNELKDCPFCGSKPLMKHIGNDHTKTRAVEVKCSNAECRIARTDKAFRYDHAWLTNVAIEGWNRRALAAPVASAAPSGEATEALRKLRYHVDLTYKLCCDTAPKQSVGELLNVTLALPDWKTLEAAIAHQPPKEALTWQKLMTAGQVKKGDYVRFNLCGETKVHQVALILNAGTDKEEIIYHKRNNWYLITSMSIKGEGSQKNVEFLPVIASLAAAGVKEE